MKIALYIILDIIFLYICVAAGEFPGFCFYVTVNVVWVLAHKFLLVKAVEVDSKVRRAESDVE